MTECHRIGTDEDGWDGCHRIGTDEDGWVMYARDCAAPPSPHYTDGDGNYVVIPDAIVAKVRAAGVAAGRLFASEFPGEVLDPAATDWDAVAWQSDLADGLLGEYGEWLADELWATYSAALVEETIRLA